MVITIKGYELDIDNKNKLLNEYNNEYGFSLKPQKIELKSYLKPKNIVNNDSFLKKG